MRYPFNELPTTKVPEGKEDEFFLTTIERAILSGAYSIQQIHDAIVKDLTDEAIGMGTSRPAIDRYYLAAASIKPLVGNIVHNIDCYLGKGFYSRTVAERVDVLRFVELLRRSVEMMQGFQGTYADDIYDNWVDTQYAGSPAEVIDYDYLDAGLAV